MNQQELVHKLIEIFKYKESYQNQTSKLLPQDMYVLERVYFHGSMQPREISDMYHIPPSTLTGVLDRLERRQFIKRVKHLQNRKAILIEITEKGKKIVEQHLEEDKVFAENFIKVLSRDKREKLKELLAELVENLQVNDLFKKED